MADFYELELSKDTYKKAYDYDNKEEILKRQSFCDAHSNFKISEVTKKQCDSLAKVLFYMIATGKETVHIVSGREQCEGGKRRSSEDVYMCAKYYLKGIDYITVLKALDICSSTDSWLFSKNFCSEVLLMVYTNRYLPVSLIEIEKCLEADGLNYEVKKVIK